MAAEVRALAEEGVFSLPGGTSAKTTTNTTTRTPRHKKTRNQEKEQA